MRRSSTTTKIMYNSNNNNYYTTTTTSKWTNGKKQIHKIIIYFRPQNAAVSSYCVSLYLLLVVSSTALLCAGDCFFWFFLLKRGHPSPFFQVVSCWSLFEKCRLFHEFFRGQIDLQINRWLVFSYFMQWERIRGIGQEQGQTYDILFNFQLLQSWRVDQKNGRRETLQLNISRNIYIQRKKRSTTFDFLFRSSSLFPFLSSMVIDGPQVGGYSCPLNNFNPSRITILK